MGNRASKSDSDSSVDLGNIFHDTTTDEETDEEEAATVPRMAAGATASVTQTVGDQQATVASKKEEKKGFKPLPHGLEGVNDEEWETWEGPQRIRTSQLSKDDRERFSKMVDRIFDKDTLMGQKIIFTPREIADVVYGVIPYLESEPMLIEDVPFDIVIVGDLHGQLYDLNRVFKLHASADGKPGWECMKYLFLGDYVDRGRQAPEIVMALFCLKMLHPDRIFLLRGNHEFLNTNLADGFGMDIRERYDKEKTATAVFHQFNEAFSYLSIAAIIGNVYFAAHGGISPAGFTRRHLRGKYKPLILADDDIVLQDIVWSDPAQGLKGTTFNKERGVSCFFGYDELCLALERMEVVAVFRGHSMMKEGYSNAWNVCFTIFTATDYCDSKNRGAVAHVDATGKTRFTVLEINQKRSAWERKLQAIEYTQKADADQKTEKLHGFTPDIKE